ncbi:MAG TPA: glycoside hydrolase family 31 protein [Terrimicrobiaceae bacterium]
MSKLIDIRHYFAFAKTGRCLGLEKGIEVELEAERLRVTVLREDLFQLKISHAGGWEETPSHAVCAEMRAMKADFSVDEREDRICVVTSKMTLTIFKNPFGLAAHRADGSVILETLSDDKGTSWAYARLNDHFVTIRRCRHEDAFFGLGEKTGGFNRKGRNFTLWNTDVLNPDAAGEFAAKHEQGDPRADPRSTEFDPYYVSIPFFYHLPHMQTEMAGFFFDNPYRASFEFSETKEYRVHFHGGQYTEYIFAGPSMKEILGAYTMLTGRIQAPPLWALGNHQCRWFPYTQKAVEKLAALHRKKGIPCDTLWLDIDYMDGYRVFTWNQESFPAPDQMLGRLREQGFRVVTIIDPGVKFEPGYRVFDEASKGDLLCKTPQGTVYVGQVWPGRTAFPDFSLEETRKWWGGLNAEHVKSGLAGIWNDMNEPATGNVPLDEMCFGHGKHAHARFHNEYALLMAMGTVEGLLAALPELRTFVLTRAGSPGIQRYAANWLGDNCSRWEHLAMSVPMAMGFGVSGQPFVGADIGGFVEDGSMELLLRWYQCGALTPFCRNHNCVGQRDQYPWVYGEAAEDICRSAIALRYRLMPYIYTQFILAAETGSPVQRPLVFQYQDDHSARHIDDQYLFGSDLLVAPIFRAGDTSRHVYLPAGSWQDWRSGEIITGRRWISAPAPLSSIPLYARGGTVIPLWPEAPPSTMGYFPERIELQVFVPEEDGETISFLHEDDGCTFALREGKFLRTAFVLSRHGQELVIHASTSGEGFPEFARKEFLVRFQGNITDVYLNDRSLEIEQGAFVISHTQRDFVLRAKILE